MFSRAFIKSYSILGSHSTVTEQRTGLAVENSFRSTRTTDANELGQCYSPKMFKEDVEDDPGAGIDSPTKLKTHAREKATMLRFELVFQDGKRNILTTRSRAHINM